MLMHNMWHAWHQQVWHAGRGLPAGRAALTAMVQRILSAGRTPLTQRAGKALQLRLAARHLARSAASPVPLCLLLPDLLQSHPAAIRPSTLLTELSEDSAGRALRVMASAWLRLPAEGELGLRWVLKQCIWGVQVVHHRGAARAGLAAGPGMGCAGGPAPADRDCAPLHHPRGPCSGGSGQRCGRDTPDAEASPASYNREVTIALFWAAQLSILLPAPLLSHSKLKDEGCQKRID